MIGVAGGVTQSRIRVRFGDSASILYRGSLYMVHAVRSSFNFCRRTENPRVGGSIPSLAIDSEVKADNRLSSKPARAGVLPMFGGKRGDTARVCASTSIVGRLGAVSHATRDAVKTARPCQNTGLMAKAHRLPGDTWCWE